jgi:hypothetical protein
MASTLMAATSAGERMAGLPVGIGSGGAAHGDDQVGEALALGRGD